MQQRDDKDKLTSFPFDFRTSRSALSVAANQRCVNPRQSKTKNICEVKPLKHSSRQRSNMFPHWKWMSVGCRAYGGRPASFSLNLARAASMLAPVTRLLSVAARGERTGESSAAASTELP